MSRMAESLFATSPVLAFPVLAMFLFFGVFAAVTIRALRAPSRDIARAASLPFEEKSDD